LTASEFLDSKLPAVSKIPYKDEAFTDDSYDNIDSQNHSDDDSDNAIITTLKEKLFQQPRRSKRVSHPVFTKIQLMHIEDDSKEVDNSYSEDLSDIEDQDDIESVVDTNRAKGTAQRKQRRHNYPYTAAQNMDIVKIANRINTILQTAIYSQLIQNQFATVKIKYIRSEESC
jgi:hypothetical protein